MTTNPTQAHQRFCTSETAVLQAHWYGFLQCNGVPLPFLHLQCFHSVEVTGSIHMGHILPLEAYNSLLWTLYASVYLEEVTEMV